jgi:hypothetical protein
MMLAVPTSKPLFNLYQSTQRYKPQGSHLHTHSHENLKAYMLKVTEAVAVI